MNLQQQSTNLRPRLRSIATANPGKRYSQQDVLDLFGVTDRKISSLFTNSHIESRYLCLPEIIGDRILLEETSLELSQKHRKHSLLAGQKAIENALQSAEISPSDIDYMVCVTSTGFLCPGLTAHYIKSMGFRQDIHRIDIVGMGCNGGLNGMQPLVNYCKQNPKGNALLVCVEICSAAYKFDMTMRTSVVNSLFGDGAVAAVFCNHPEFGPDLGPEILGFKSHIIPEHIDAMRFDFEDNKYSFFLDRNIPYLLGEHIGHPISALLDHFGLKKRDIEHWIIHSGGRKILDSIKYTLDLSVHDIRHTESVLRDFGNLSSGSFLFSHKRLLEEKVAKHGDYIVMITMGPGATIECCLGRF